MVVPFHILRSCICTPYFTYSFTHLFYIYINILSHFFPLVRKHRKNYEILVQPTSGLFIDYVFVRFEHSSPAVCVRGDLSSENFRVCLGGRAERNVSMRTRCLSLLCKYIKYIKCEFASHALISTSRDRPLMQTRKFECKSV